MMARDRKKEKKYRLVQWLTALALAALVLGLAVTAALQFRPLYSADIGRYRLTEVSGLSKETLEENYRILIDYNTAWGPDTLEFPDFAMSEQGRIHFAEAKQIFLAFFWMIPIGGAAALAGILYCSKKRVVLYRAYASILTVALPAAAGIFFAADWERAFVLFHKVFFRNDLWIFNPATDPVINVLPDGFFFHEAMLIVGLVLAGAVILFLWFLSGRRKLRRQASSSEKAG